MAWFPFIRNSCGSVKKNAIRGVTSPLKKVDTYKRKEAKMWSFYTRNVMR